MSEPSLRRHGLESFLEALPQNTSADAGVSIQLQPELGHINLRGDPENPEFLKSVMNTLGQELPVIPNTMSLGSHRVYWLGPNEWLVVTSIEVTRQLIANLREALADKHASVTELSGGQIAMRISGPHVRDVLAKGCTLDLQPAEFGARACAQSGLARANILIGHLDEETGFEIVVRRSFAEYLVLWLQHGAREFNAEFTVIQVGPP